MSVVFVGGKAVFLTIVFVGTTLRQSCLLGFSEGNNTFGGGNTITTGRRWLVAERSTRGWKTGHLPRPSPARRLQSDLSIISSSL